MSRLIAIKPQPQADPHEQLAANDASAIVPLIPAALTPPPSPQPSGTRSIEQRMHPCAPLPEQSVPQLTVKLPPPLPRQTRANDKPIEIAAPLRAEPQIEQQQLISPAPRQRVAPETLEKTDTPKQTETTAPLRAEPRIEQQQLISPAPRQRVAPETLEKTDTPKQTETTAPARAEPEIEPQPPISPAPKQRVLEAVWIEGMGHRKQLDLPHAMKPAEPQLKGAEPLARLAPEPGKPGDDSAPDHSSSPEHRPALFSAPPPVAAKSVPPQPVPFELALAREPVRTISETLRPPAPAAAQPAAIVEQIVARIAMSPTHGVINVVLDPPELGRVLIKFQRRGRELSVRVEAEHTEAIRQLRHELPQLEAALSRLREPVLVEVLAQGESRDAGLLPQREHSAANQNSDRPSHGRSDREATPHQERRRPRPRSPESQLDVWS